jgi:hypothetical protein
LFCLIEAHYAGENAKVQHLHRASWCSWQQSIWVGRYLFWNIFSLVLATVQTQVRAWLAGSGSFRMLCKLLGSLDVLLAQPVIGVSATID